MEYTTSPPHFSSPRPTYHGCAGVILTPYIHAPHSTPSISSSSDPDVTSLAAPPFPWAARGLLAWRLGGCLTRLRVLFVSFETRVTPFAPSHSMHVAGRSLRHSLRVNPPGSLRTLHFLHALHHMTDRTRYHHPSSSANIGFSLAKCTSGMEKMSSLPHFLMLPSVLCYSVVAVSPVSSLEPPTDTLECALKIPATLLELLPCRLQ